MNSRGTDEPMCKPAKSECHSSGFTLVEAMMSLLILSVVMLGLLQTVMIASDSNVRTAMRSAGVQLANERLEQMRNYSGDTTKIQSGVTTKKVKFKSTDMTYTLNQTVSTTTGSSVRVDVNVTWGFQGQTYSYNTSTIVRP